MYLENSKDKKKQKSDCAVYKAGWFIYCFSFVKVKINLYRSSWVYYRL